MKRSKINSLIDEAISFIESLGFKMPPFAYWNPQQWQTKKATSQEIAHNMLGWDVTDFGSGDFDRRGLVVLTIRNGNPHDKERYPSRMPRSC